MFSKTLTTWIGLAGLTIALAGCGDDGGSGDTNNTTDPTGNATTDPTGSATTDPTGSATTDDPTGSATTDPTGGATTDPGSSSGGGAECDPACADNEECIEGVCFPTGGDTTGDPPADNSDYGPCQAGCPEGEMPVGLGDMAFCFCSPSCDGMGSMCPMPNDGTAAAQCVLTFEMGAPPTQCAIVCDNTEQCPAGASCEGMVCQHPTGG